MRIHHIGIAVKSLEEAVPVFELLLGCQARAPETVGEQQVRMAILPVGNSRIELLEATSPESPIAKFIARRGAGMHHLTLTVPDLPAALNGLSEKGLRLIDREPRRGGGSERIAFLHPSSTAGVLIELVEERNESGAGSAAE